MGACRDSRDQRMPGLPGCRQSRLSKWALGSVRLRKDRLETSPRCDSSQIAGEEGGAEEGIPSFQENQSISQCFLFSKFHHDDVDLYIYMWYCDRLMMDACILHTYGVRRMVWMKGKGLEPNNKNNNKNNRKLADISPGIC